MPGRRPDRQPTTRFGLLLQQYMWDQRPPLTAADLARRVGISKQTIGNWLDGRTRPQPIALEVLSNRTGIPLATLYEALQPEVDESRPARELDALAETVENTSALSDTAREQMLRILREERGSYGDKPDSETPRRAALMAASHGLSLL